MDAVRGDGIISLLVRLSVQGIVERDKGDPIISGKLLNLSGQRLLPGDPVGIFLRVREDKGFQCQDPGIGSIGNIE